MNFTRNIYEQSSQCFRDELSRFGIDLAYEKKLYLWSEILTSKNHGSVLSHFKDKPLLRVEINFEHMVDCFRRQGRIIKKSDAIEIFSWIIRPWFHYLTPKADDLLMQLEDSEDLMATAILKKRSAGGFGIGVCKANTPGHTELNVYDVKDLNRARDFAELLNVLSGKSYGDMLRISVSADCVREEESSWLFRVFLEKDSSIPKKLAQAIDKCILDSRDFMKLHDAILDFLQGEINAAIKRDHNLFSLNIDCNIIEQFINDLCVALIKEHEYHMYDEEYGLEAIAETIEWQISALSRTSAKKRH